MRRQGGFTLVELTIALALFSFTLLIMTVGVIQLFKIYQAGIGIRNTQQSARLISEELSRTARDAGAVYAAGDHVCFFNPTGSGTVSGGHLNASSITYYVTPGSFSANAPATGYHLMRLKNPTATVSVTTGPNPIVQPVATDCPLPASGGDQVSSSDVAVVLFSTWPSPGTSLIFNYDIRIASVFATSNEIDLTSPANPTCVPGYQYCSITPITSSAMVRTQLVPGP
jgi:prepilin-type N-terminal cleavage/methylation domain-containing protein